MQRLLFSLCIALVACGAPPQSSAMPTSGAVTVRATAVSGGHALVIDNGSGAVLRVRREIEVERPNAGAWEHVEASWLLVRTTCEEHEPPACIEIPAGTTLTTVPWNDMFGDAQCACEECGPAGAGTYRFALTPCDGGARLETSPFAVE